MGSTLIGQYSGLYVLFLGAGAYLFGTDRRFLAGVVLSLLWLKPNIAVAVPVVLVWSRSWRTLLGMAAGTAGLVLASVPLGLERWGEFVAAADRMAQLQEQGFVPVDKMVTALSSIQTLFGLEAAVGVSTTIWLLIASVLGVMVLLTWSKGRPSDDPLRAFGALALFVVAANPRLYFYDGVLVGLGMLGVWASAGLHNRYSERRILSIIGVLVWVGSWGNIWSSVNVLVGPLAASALIVAGSGCLQSVRSPGVAEDPASLDESATQISSYMHSPSQSAPGQKAA